MTEELTQYSPQYIEHIYRAHDKIVDFLINETEIATSGTQEHLKRLYKANIFGGKLLRGSLVLHIVNICSKFYNVKPDFELASVVGFCLEAIHASFLVADDVIDKSETRRCAPCWYKYQDVFLSSFYNIIFIFIHFFKIGLSAINDSLILEHSAFQVLEHFLAGHEKLLELIPFIQHCVYETVIGEYLDIHTCFLQKEIHSDGQDMSGSAHDIILQKLSKQNFESICEKKTSVYTFYMPFICGLACAQELIGEDISSAALKADIRAQCMSLGVIFQAVVCLHHISTIE